MDVLSEVRNVGSGVGHGLLALRFRFRPPSGRCSRAPSGEGSHQSWRGGPAGGGHRRPFSAQGPAAPPAGPAVAGPGRPRPTRSRMAPSRGLAPTCGFPPACGLPPAVWVAAPAAPALRRQLAGAGRGIDFSSGPRRQLGRQLGGGPPPWRPGGVPRHAYRLSARFPRPGRIVARARDLSGPGALPGGRVGTRRPDVAASARGVDRKRAWTLGPFPRTAGTPGGRGSLQPGRRRRRPRWGAGGPAPRCGADSARSARPGGLSSGLAHRRRRRGCDGPGGHAQPHGALPPGPSRRAAALVSAGAAAARPAALPGRARLSAGAAPSPGTAPSAGGRLSARVPVSAGVPVPTPAGTDGVVSSGGRRLAGSRFGVLASPGRSGHATPAGPGRTLGVTSAAARLGPTVGQLVGASERRLAALAQGLTPPPRWTSCPGGATAWSPARSEHRIRPRRPLG